MTENIKEFLQNLIDWLQAIISIVGLILLFIPSYLEVAWVLLGIGFILAFFIQEPEGGEGDTSYD